MTLQYDAICFVLILALSNALSVPCGIQSMAIITQLPGKVKGIGIASDEAVLPEATVIIKGEQVTQRSTTDWNGTFEFDLPAGIYEITTEI
ncbi:MAG: carboxypeptidase-like regulatory domain-containing protein, partial [Acidobacteria bacterium]|nr:carboxypeptidase-like regulatory domain-containing protein [Acidobacteriota bacterium]